MKTIEQNTAETLLQQPEAVAVGGKTYMIAPPSIATLVLVSRSIAELPHVRLDQDRVLESSLAIAKNCQDIGDIAATLILGAKRCFETKTIVRKASKRILWGLFHFRAKRPRPSRAETHSHASLWKISHRSRCTSLSAKPSSKCRSAIFSVLPLSSPKFTTFFRDYPPFTWLLPFCMASTFYMLLLAIQHPMTSIARYNFLS